MGKLIFYISLWAAKASRVLLRALGRNATNFPGRIALTLCPNFLSYVEKPQLIVAITGTNGKTTVCNLALDILKKSGQQVMNNRLGSNTAAGIVSSFAEWSTMKGKATCPIAILEVDERSSKKIYPYIKPQIILVTNLFRDSIKRNAHAEYIAGIIGSCIPAESKLILNADDLISCDIAPQNSRVYYGIERMASDVTECVNRINDISLCPRCHGRLKYDYRRYHHIGRAHCESCPFESPGYDYMAHSVDLGNMEMYVTDPGGEYRKYRLLSDSVFNIYNELAVIALLHEMGASTQDIAAALDETKIAETRFNSVRGGGVNVVMQMAKDMNALACSRAFDYVGSLPGEKEIILMMYNVYGYSGIPENVTWLYDCDFEFLNRDNITRLVAVGPCADDYYMRLLMAGIPEDRLRCVKNADAAIPLLSYTPGESIYIFYGTDILSDVFALRDKLLEKAVQANPNLPESEPAAPGHYEPAAAVSSMPETRETEEFPGEAPAELPDAEEKGPDAMKDVEPLPLPPLDSIAENIDAKTLFGVDMGTAPTGTDNAEDTECAGEYEAPEDAFSVPDADIIFDTGEAREDEN